jgi:hypothetical protein
MLKIYTWLSSRLKTAEISVESRIKRRLDGRQSGLFSVGLIFLDLQLFFLELALNVARFFIVIFLDSSLGFNAVFRQQELHRCKYPYAAYKEKQKKLRTFSYGSFATMIIAVGIISLVMNLLFSDKLTGWAQTFSWQQTSWTTGASSTAIATHSNNQTGWTRFSSSTANIATTSTGITLTASSVTAFNHTADADFSGTKSAEIYVSGGSIRLAKPFGASCTSDVECTDGLAGLVGGWCDTVGGNICRNPWVSSICTSTLDNIGSTLMVMRKDLSPSGYVWGPTGVGCDTPYCGIDGAQNGDNLVANNAINFAAAGYVARDACKAQGARLPTIDELKCIYANRSNYNTGGAFAAIQFWSATEYNINYIYDLNFSNGAVGSGTTQEFRSAANRVRCVKAQ